MNCTECIETRRSSRAFLDKPVDKKHIARALSAASHSPSYMNTQPWEIYAVMGKHLEILAEKLHNAASSNEPRTPDIPLPQTWPSQLEQRAADHRDRRFAALGLDPSKDSEKIRQGMLKNFNFFNAPCAIFATMERSLTAWSIFDMGAYLHAFLLALHEEGLGAVPQAQPVSYPHIIRHELGIPESKAIVIAVSVGYPDSAAPANLYRATRKDMSEFVYWYE